MSSCQLELRTCSWDSPTLHSPESISVQHYQMVAAALGAFFVVTGILAILACQGIIAGGIGGNSLSGLGYGLSGVMMVTGALLVLSCFLKVRGGMQQNLTL